MRTPVYATSRVTAAGKPPAALWRGSPLSAAGPADPRHLLIIKAVGLLSFLLAPLWISGLFFAGNYDYSSAMALVPLLIFANLGLVVWVSTRDPLLRAAMFAGTLVKAAGAAAYLTMSYRVYETGSDALHYFTVGQDLVNSFWVHGEWPLMLPLWSTNLVNTLTAYLIILMGPSLPALFVLFALFAFWGSFYFYRAFCLTFPEGNRSAAALLLFFLPSSVLWTSSIGKDAVIAFFLGLAAYGFALSRVRPGFRSYLVLGIGLLGCMAIRPHVAAMLATAIVIPHLFSRNRRGIIGGLYKALGFAILVGGSLFLVSQAQEFLQISDFKTASSTLEHITTSTRSGGSAFGAQTSLPVRIALAPLLLFRPLPWEAHNPQSAVAALEGLALLILFWRARKGILRLVRGWRSNPYVLLILLYAAEFCVAFAAASANFGTLSRMRVMLLPFAIMLLCGPPMVIRPAAGPAKAVRHPLRGSPLPETR